MISRYLRLLYYKEGLLVVLPVNNSKSMNKVLINKEKQQTPAKVSNCMKYWSSKLVLKAVKTRSIMFKMFLLQSVLKPFPYLIAQRELNKNLFLPSLFISRQCFWQIKEEKIKHND